MKENAAGQVVRQEHGWRGMKKTRCGISQQRRTIGWERTAYGMKVYMLCRVQFSIFVCLCKIFQFFGGSTTIPSPCFFRFRGHFPGRADGLVNPESKKSAPSISTRYKGRRRALSSMLKNTWDGFKHIDRITRPVSPHSRLQQCHCLATRSNSD